MMDDTIFYLNNDLDLVSAEDLTVLAAAIESAGIPVLNAVTLGDNGLWYASFETNEQYAEPEPNIAAMLAAIEALPQAVRTAWDRCREREFNIGYDCGSKPWAFNQGLSTTLLARISAAGASLRLTLYPDR
ncbi:MAG: hypothetical protein K8T25_06630 [Planctomycetia bacterium]|nr:hypothetical protein [Planctomycetia bacterium]